MELTQGELCLEELMAELVRSFVNRIMLMRAKGDPKQLHDLWKEFEDICEDASRMGHLLHNMSLAVSGN